MQIIIQIVMVEYIVQFQCVFISNFKNIVCLIHINTYDVYHWFKKVFKRSLVIISANVLN